jgi:hypothetical protein
LSTTRQNNHFVKTMNLSKKLVILPFALFCLSTFAGDLSIDLQKACVKEQLGAHSEIKGHPVEAKDFTEYCKCETGLITEKATKEQLNEISKKQSTNPNWLNDLKSSAFKICLQPKGQLTT